MSTITSTIKEKQLLKCATSILVALALIFTSCLTTSAFAEVAGYEAGAIGNQLLKAGQYEYEEYTFITGEPVLLKGTITVPTTVPTGTKYTQSYTYELENTEKVITISRKATYTVTLTKDEGLKQTTENVVLTKLDEAITVNGVNYTLGRYTYSGTGLKDNTPAVDYLSGSLYLERLFYKNGDAKKNDGTLTITNTSDQIVGYKHKWGNLETRTMNQRIQFDPPTTNGTQAAGKWTGTMNILISSVDKTGFTYKTTNPQNISFRGSYIMNRTQENVAKITYDLPLSGKETVRNRGTKTLKRNVVVTNTSLNAPKIRDVGGHYAEKDILLLGGLKILDDYDKTSGVAARFSPNTPMTRMDFAKALARSIGEVKPLTKEDIIKRDRPGFEKIVTYSDVAATNPDITTLEFLTQKGVIVGEGQYFYPDKAITRAEAVGMMVNALGLTGLAPQPPYKIGYKDDSQIDASALSHKDAIYMAHEVGLITEFKDGTFKPGATVNRGDAAAMINKMMTHIREKITPDYREKLM